MASELELRHEGGGMLAFYRDGKRVREIGPTPGWNFRDRDELIVGFNSRATPQDGAVSEDAFRDAVFDGSAVLAAVSERERKFVSPESVSAVLDAVNRLARAAIAARGGATRGNGGGHG